MLTTTTGMGRQFVFVFADPVGETRPEGGGAPASDDALRRLRQRHRLRPDVVAAAADVDGVVGRGPVRKARAEALAEAVTVSPHRDAFRKRPENARPVSVRRIRASVRRERVQVPRAERPAASAFKSGTELVLLLRL